MKRRATAFIAVAALICLLPAAGLALSAYSQDFEGLVQGDTAALANDGWLVFGNVFGLDWAYWYGYGPFPAPNDGFGFCAIASGEGGVDQGAQQLVVFSDYNNGDHPNAWIESNVFQEQTVLAGDVGQTYVFDFQAKMGNLDLRSTAAAFIKTLDPNNGWITTNFITLDMTAIPAAWGDYSLELPIDAGLVGQIFQFGFMNVATDYESSGIFYDNINFGIDDGVATATASWGAVKSLY
jgi:hypothetical protein